MKNILYIADEKKVVLLILLLIVCLLLPFVVIAEKPAQKQESHWVNLSWGVPEYIEMTQFSGLERKPQAEEVLLHNDKLTLIWQTDKSYIVPMFAYSEHTLTGVRYKGQHIPKTINLEWLDPWNRIWYPLEKIPSDMIHVIISNENNTYSINFGPPEGAAFDRETVRFIWFRITPSRAGEFQITLMGFLPDENNKKRQISNNLILKAEVLRK